MYSSEKRHRVHAVVVFVLLHNFAKDQGEMPYAYVATFQ